MIRRIVAVGAAVLLAASVSGATEQPPEPIETGLPAPHFGPVRSGPFALAGLRERARPLGQDAPRWARRLYWRSLHVLLALTHPRSGAMIAGERDGWGYLWPHDAAAGRGLDRAHGLVGLGARRARRAPARGSPARRPAPCGDAAGDAA